jgi:hypothetical protein
MEGPSEKGAPRPKAVDRTAGVRRSTRPPRPVEHYVPGVSSSQKTPSRIVRLQLPIQLKNVDVLNSAAITNRATVSNIATDANSSTVLTRSPTANSTADFSAPTSGPNAKFHFFPRLAAELRHTIWKYYLPGPRIQASEEYQWLFLQLRS